MTVSIDHKNLRLLASEIFETQRNLNPSFMNQIFVEKDTPRTLHSGRNILALKPNTAGYGIENPCFSWMQDVACIAISLKESQTLNSFLRIFKSCNLLATVDYVNDMLRI